MCCTTVAWLRQGAEPGHLAQEVEALLATYIQRGAGVETQILTTIGAQLPADWKASLPLELQASQGCLRRC